jgi:hypothetical protein
MIFPAKDSSTAAAAEMSAVGAATVPDVTAGSGLGLVWVIVLVRLAGV